jgi:hypothetical protein
LPAQNPIGGQRRVAVQFSLVPNGRRQLRDIRLPSDKTVPYVATALS